MARFLLVLKPPLFPVILFGLVLITSCNTKINEEPKDSIFDMMNKGYAEMNFLSTIAHKKLKKADYHLLETELKKINFVRIKPSTHIQIASDSINTIDDANLYRSTSSRETIYIEKSDNTFERWSAMHSKIGRYTGINGSKGCYYLKLDAGKPSSLNATFRSNDFLINIRNPLNFEIIDFETMMPDELKEYEAANKDLAETLKVLSKVMSTKADLVYRPLNGRLLTSEERLFGFVNFWSEVKYNFAFFDQVSDLDWDQVLLEYLPKIGKDQSNIEYYKLMQEICAKLSDGHTNVYFPKELEKKNGNVPLEFMDIDDKIYITNSTMEYENIIELGSTLISVNKIPVEDYILNIKYPQISSSTRHIKRKIAVATLLEVEIDQKIELEIRLPSGEIKILKLTIDQYDAQWIRPKDSSLELFKYRRYGDLSYISLNSFGTPNIFRKFEEHIDSISKSNGLIIDLRKNGGGNSNNGYEILKYLTSKPFLTSKWKTREHKASYKAWGSFVDTKNPNLGSWDKEALQTYIGDFWYESSADTILPHVDKHLDLPIAILIGNNTASAAEDFLVAAESISLGTTIGDFTYGSTGQPLLMALPGGGSARICTKRDTYPDGKEFVGYGIKPHHFVKKTINDVLQEKDPILEFAIDFLGNRRNSN